MTMLRKLFCNQTFLQAINASRTDTQRHRHSPGRIHTHLASVACDVSCRRLVASLCRFARSLCACGRGESQASCLNVFAVLEGGNHKAKTTMTMLRKLFRNQTFLQAINANRTDTQRHRHSPGRIHTHLASLACDVSCWRLVASLCRSARSLCVCVVSCWRLVAFLCRFARNLSARASSVSHLRVAAAL